MKQFFMKLTIGVLLAIVLIMFLSAIDVGAITIPIAVKDWSENLEDFVLEKTEGAVETIKESITNNVAEEETAEVIVGDIDGELEIHFIDVGQGDATLIKCGDDAMLIDAGFYDKGDFVEEYVDRELEDNHLDYVIATHPDADHIGGLSEVFYSDALTIDTIFFSSYEREDDGTMYYVEEAMRAKEYTAEVPSYGSAYQLGDAIFTIVGPTEEYEDCNNNSICIMLVYGDNKFLFCGDAEEDAEEDMLKLNASLDCDVLKISHHGSNTSSTKDFIEETTPDYAVISVGENNEYYQPHASVLNTLRKEGVNVFRTDEQGSIICTSNGTEIKWNCMPSTTWQAGEGEK